MTIEDLYGEAIPKHLREEVLDEKMLYDGKVVHLVRQDIKLEDGYESTREVVLHSGGVAILALTEDEKVYMVRQYRTAAQSALLELPAGKLEPGEDPYESAIRELEEECAIKAQTLEPLGKFYPTPGYCSEVIHLYWTKDFAQGEQNLDPGETLDVFQVPLEDLLIAVAENKIHDAKTQLAVLRYLQLRSRK